VLGGLLVSTWGGLKHKRVYGVLVPMLVAGIVQLVYGLSPLVLISAAAEEPLQNGGQYQRCSRVLPG
jgi:DHA3 family macrolide efflux protein-like MFS transporter